MSSALLSAIRLVEGARFSANEQLGAFAGGPRVIARCAAMCDGQRNGGTYVIASLLVLLAAIAGAALQQLSPYIAERTHASEVRRVAIR